jgi:hypothetical protein
MRIIILRIIIFFSLFTATTPSGFAAISGSTVIITPGKIIFEKSSSLKVKDIQKMLGRKLTLKEKISLFILKHTIRHKTNEPDHLGEASLILGILGVVFLLTSLLWPPLILGSLAASIAAIITGSVAMKKNKSDKMAYAGKLLGWITLGLLALLLILIIIAISFWRVY